MSITSYEVIKSEYADTLAASVQQAIENGKQPYAAPFISANNILHQAVVEGSADSGSGPNDGDLMAVVTENGVAVPSQGTFVAEYPIGNGVTIPAAKLASGNAVVTNTNSIVVRDAVGDAIVAAEAVVVVQADDTVDVRLGGSTACIVNGFALTGVEPVGTFTDTVTFEVTGGAITGITLS